MSADFDPQIKKFGEWVAQQTDEAVEIKRVSAPEGGGLSHRTLIIDLRIGNTDERLVLRMAPTGLPLFPKYDFAQQVKLLRALRVDSTVPVVPVRYYEPSPEPIGEEFYVMDFALGQIPPDNPGYQFDGWVKDLEPTKQNELLNSSLETMARIHRVDWPARDMSFLDRPQYGDNSLDQEFGFWRDYLDWASDGSPVPAIEDAFVKCQQTRPTELADPALVWGDARWGNMVYNQQLGVQAVLDWEMAVLGPAELDLGWYFFLERTALQYSEQLPGFSDRETTIKTYEGYLGRSVSDIEWYELWGGVRAGCIQIRLSRILGELGVVDDANYRGRNPVTRALRAILG